ncbi:MAG: hypothetical protein AAF683_00775 [Pseudomonadota bacterium]
MQKPGPDDDKNAREQAALRQLEELKRQLLTPNAEEWHALHSPLVREHIEGEGCWIIGKVLSRSPFYFDVAILVGNKVVRRKVSEKSVHLAKCD